MRRAGVTGALVLLLVAGCTSSGGKGESSSPDPTPPTGSTPVTSSTPTSSSTSPSPSVSIPTTGPNVRPGEKVPTRPAAANVNTAPGSTVLATYWFRTLDWGYATTSSALPRTVYASQCTACGRLMHDFDDARRDGYHFIGGRITISTSSVVRDDARFGAQRVADVTVSAGPLKAVDSHGKTVATSVSVSNLRYRVYMRWEAGVGRVVNYGRAISK